MSARIKQTIHAERIDVVATQLPIEVSNSVDGRCRLMMKYRLKDSVPAVYHTHEGGELRVMLPARAIGDGVFPVLHNAQGNSRNSVGGASLPSSAEGPAQ